VEGDAPGATDAPSVEAPLDLEAEANLLLDTPPSRLQERWYGWQTLTTDGASVVLLLAAAATADSGRATGALGALSLGGYLLGGPVVHLVHDNPGRALGSFALRGGLPIVLGAVGVQLEDCEDGEFFCGVGGAVIGGLLGIVGAIVIDASVLARDEVPVEASGLPDVGVSIGRDQVFIVTGGSF
jgi:hypothetical protein